MEAKLTPNQRWRQSHPDGVRAHWTVANEMKAGRIVRQPCEYCGATERIHAHHDDYSKPKEIRWLCSPCHRRHHAILLGQTIGGKPHAPRPYKRRGPQLIRSPRKTAPKYRYHADAQAMRLNGLTYQQIATAVGVTPGTVFKWLNATTYN